MNPFDELHWYACRTRSRAEKQVDRLLAGLGCETYLPLIMRERRWADRKKRVAFPLFTGYTFARFQLHKFEEIIQTPGLVRVLSSTGRGYPTPVDEGELESVRRLVEGIEETGSTAEPADWAQPGVPVEVIEGPFQGMFGTLLERRGQARVAVGLSAINVAVSVQVDISSLRPFPLESPHP